MEIQPLEANLKPPAAAKNQDIVMTLKLPRAQMMAAVKNSGMPAVWQAVLLEEMAVIDPRHDLLRLDFVRHAHGVGSNFSGTIKEI